MDKRKLRNTQIALTNTQEAVDTGSFVVIACHQADGKTLVNVVSNAWPVGDYQVVLDLLEDDFAKRQRNDVLQGRAKKNGSAV